MVLSVVGLNVDIIVHTSVNNDIYMNYPTNLHNLIKNVVGLSLSRDGHEVKNVLLLLPDLAAWSCRWAM